MDLKILQKGFRLPFLGEIRYYYLLILFLLIGYIITKNVIVGLLCGLSIVGFFLFEVFEGIKGHGIKKEILELLVALVAAFLLYNLVGFILNTPSPISAIVSCSMLPDYDRGDLIVIANWPINTFYINYSKALDKELKNIEVYYKNQKIQINRSLYVYCLENIANDVCKKFFYEEPENFYEKIGPIKIEYKMCKKINTKTKEINNIPCLSSTYFEDKKIDFNKSFDLIVYNPKRNDGTVQQIDIIHRALFAVNNSGKIYYFTKGDNNPIYDFQYYVNSNKMSYLIEEQQIKGKLILKIPYLGNLKLVITPQVLLLDEIQTGCWGYFQ